MELYSLIRNFATILCALMRIIKKLDIYILKNYLLLFAATFFVCLFIFMMQFLFKHINDLIGKGLGWDIIAQFFFYACLTLVSMSVPLAVLLASLISFGNMGEQLELLAMKASGVPLTRILAPIFVLVCVICGGSFYFQNNVQPMAMRQLATLMWSMRQKSPELEIPEGVFYNNIPGYSLFVERKDTKTGLLYGIVIYSTQGGYDNMEIVLADSARLQSTADRQHLKLTLYNGERFRNMDNQSGQMLKASIPYMRESFGTEVDLIRFDASFNMMDANLFNGDAQVKSLASIVHGIDSIAQASDSLGRAYYALCNQQYLKWHLPAGRPDSSQIVSRGKMMEPLDSLYLHLPQDSKTRVMQNALSSAQGAQAEFDYRAMITEGTNVALRRHKIEARKKFTMSLSCLLFFFIGAPLGAIIRKGGLGVPVVVSVLIFIFYYIINAGSEKMAKAGELAIWIGAWFSSMVLAPVGVFLTNRANKDSVVFNIEGYRNFFMRLLGLRRKRRINRKEVVIHEPDYSAMRRELTSLSASCKEYQSQHKLLRLPSYWNIFFRFREDHVVIDLDNKLSDIITELHNCQDNVVISLLNEYPIIAPDAHTRPTRNPRWNVVIGLFVPLGMALWLRIWRYRIRLYRDLSKIASVSESLERRIANEVMRL